MAIARVMMTNDDPVMRMEHARISVKTLDRELAYLDKAMDGLRESLTLEKVRALRNEKPEIVEVFLKENSIGIAGLINKLGRVISSLRDVTDSPSYSIGCPTPLDRAHDHPRFIVLHSNGYVRAVVVEKYLAEKALKISVSQVLENVVAKCTMSDENHAPGFGIGDVISCGNESAVRMMRGRRMWRDTLDGWEEVIMNTK
jgi:hypothetical protein